MALVREKLPIGVGRMLIHPTTSTLRDLVGLDTVAYGGTIGTGWVDLEETEGGITLTVTRDETEQTSDQDQDPFLILTTARRVEMNTTLLAMTLRNLAYATGMGAYSSAPATATVTGHETWKIEGTETSAKDFCLLMEVPVFGGGVARVLFPIGHPTSNISVAFQKSATAKLPFSARALVDKGVTPSVTAVGRRVIPVGGV